jgi:hypothetical protein
MICPPIADQPFTRSRASNCKQPVAAATGSLLAIEPNRLGVGYSIVQCQPDKNRMKDSRLVTE